MTPVEQIVKREKARLTQVCGGYGARLLAAVLEMRAEQIRECIPGLEAITTYKEKANLLTVWRKLATALEAAAKE